MVKELYVHIFSNMQIEGKIVRISPPGGEYQYTNYSIEYNVHGKTYKTMNTHEIDENLKMGDSVILLVVDSDYSHAVVKGSYPFLIICFIILIILEVIFISTFIQSFFNEEEVEK